jgi:2,4-dichlorophenol 6-monooxygenase
MEMTSPPMETDVLVVGAGPAGLTAATALSTYGIKTILINKYGWLADTPRAHITNQRTMEVMRDLDLEAKIVAQSSHQEMMANNVFCYSLAGEEFGRIYSWGNHPRRKADYDLASPTQICDVPQTYLEPILFEAASSRGSAVRFNMEFLDVVQDADGVTAQVKDRLSDRVTTIRAKYLIGADGARSRVAEVVGLPMEGQMGLSYSMNILFKADLTRYVAHRPSVLYWVLHPGADIGGIGAGVVRMVRPWNEWLAIWGLDASQAGVKLGEAETQAILHNMIGDSEVPIEIESTSVWTVNNMYAARYSAGRVFCMGDAVHRHPPLNGLGSNTSIQDAYNLAWKLALVLGGKAAPGLLDTYNQERQPIGRQIVGRANKSIEDYPPIFDALGLSASSDPDAANAAIAARKNPTPEGKARRRRLLETLIQKNYEFNAHGVELNQRYRSDAIIRDGSEEPAYSRDAELYYHATTWPGARLPHVWVEHQGQRKSTLDLCGQGRFTLLTGVGGDVWREAAAAVQAECDVPVVVHTIGPYGCDALDIYDDWYRQSEVEEDGCVMVRPDMHVGWRAKEATKTAKADLLDVFARVLGRRGGA